MFLVALLVGPGCAYNAAMRKGDRAAQQQDWPKAYEHYADAFKANGSTEAGDAMRDAQTKALEQWDRTTRSAVEDGDWKLVSKVWKKVTSVAGEDEPLVHDLKNAIAEGLTADVIAKIEAGESEKAYEIALTSKELFPTEIFTETALDKVRYHYRTMAENFANEGKFEESNAALKAITDREPDRSEILARQRATMEAGWADQLVQRGQEAARKKRPGTAAVYFAHAHELLKRSADLDKAHELAEEAKSAGALRVHAKYDGQWTRRKELQSRLERLVENTDGAELAGSSTGANLRLDLSVGEAKCTEAKDTTREERDYISGQIDVPNEPYVELETQLNAASDEQKAAQADVDRLKDPYAKTRAKLQGLSDAVNTAERESETAQRQLARAQKNLDEQRVLVEKLQKELESAGTVEERATATTKVNAIANNVSEWEQEVARWQKELDTATGTLAKAQSDRAPTADEHNRLKRDFEAAETRLGDATQRVNDLNLEASRVAKTVKEDVHEQFTYDVHTWTRTCEAPLYATAAPSWPSELDKSLKLSSTKVEKDTEHIGHRPSKLAADPKGFVQDREDLIGDADDENRAKLDEWVKKLTDEYYANRIATVKKALPRGPEAATEAAVDLYIAGGKLLDEATTKEIEAFLAEFHGIKKPSVLRGEGKHKPPPEIDDF